MAPPCPDRVQRRSVRSRQGRVPLPRRLHEDGGTRTTRQEPLCWRGVVAGNRLLAKRPQGSVVFCPVRTFQTLMVFRCIILCSSRRRALSCEPSASARRCRAYRRLMSERPSTASQGFFTGSQCCGGSCQCTPVFACSARVHNRRGQRKPPRFRIGGGMALANAMRCCPADANTPFLGQNAHPAASSRQQPQSALQYD